MTGAPRASHRADATARAIIGVVSLALSVMVARVVQLQIWPGRRLVEHVAELDLKDDLISYDFNCDWMATIKFGRWSQEGFKPFHTGVLKPFQYD